METLRRSVVVRRAVALLGAGAVALAAGLAYADDSASVIRVAVQIPGAAGIVEVSPEPSGYAPTSAPLDAHGIATIRHLRAGRYSVTVTLVSGASVRQLVSIGSVEMLLLEVSAAPASDVGPQMRIKERIPFQHGTEFQQPELSNLPAGDNLTTLLETAMPFVVVDRFSSGGLEVTRPGLVGTRGDSWTQSTLRFGDADFRTPTVRGWTFVPDLAIADSVAVRYGNLPLSSTSPGAAIAIEPKRPAAYWQRAFDASWTTPDLVSKSGQTVAPPIVRLDSFAHLGAQSGGPIRKGAGALVSFFGSRGVQHERDRPAGIRAGIGSATGYVIATPTPRDELRVLAATQVVHGPFEERQQFLDRNVTERQLNGFSQVTWDRIGSNGAFHELSFGGQNGGVTPLLLAPATRPGGTIERVFEGPVPDPASATVQRNINVRMRYAPPLITRGGRHHLDLGWSLDRTSLTTQQLAAPPVAELVSGVPARVWIPVAVPRSSRHVTDAVLFAADRAELSDKVTLDLGLRAALSVGSADGAMRQVIWQSLSPRFAVRVGWPIAVSAGIARYVRPVSLSALAFGDPGAPLTRVYRWMDPNGDRAFDPSERGTLIALAGRNAAIASIDPNLEAPDNWEAYLGLERQLTRTMRLSATFNVKRGHNLPRSINVGVPESSYRPVTVMEALKNGSTYVPNAVVMYERLPQSFGLDSFVLTNVNHDGVDYEGVDATWELRTKRWYSTFGGTAYSGLAAGGNRGFGVLEADYGVIGEQFETPNTTKGHSVGKLFFDRDYVGKWSTSYLAPHDVVVSFTARYQDGQAFSRLILGTDLAQGPDLITADRPGRTRFTFTATLDARIQKRFTLRGYEGAFGVDIFNLTNRADEVEENPIGGTTFRLATALQPPRTVRLHLRLSF